MIGVLASQKAPGLFGSWCLSALSPLHSDEGYVAASAKQIEELLQFLESNHMGWAAHGQSLSTWGDYKPPCLCRTS